jgi:hypothetical protein
MPYKTGNWGKEAKSRSKRRLEYFKEYTSLNGPPRKVFRLGAFGELMAKKMLNGSKIVNQHSHDLEWNRQRIEVKTTMTVKPLHGIESYTICIDTQKGKADYFFILILEPKTKELKYAYFIPDKSITAKKGLRVFPKCEASKYERFRIITYGGNG